jgi:ATP-dependent exoDNAse (exonuclease V) beta subunit
MSTLPNMSILASAGTGKTFQLSDRIVKLLALGVKHEEIAALTFTRAAAAEFIVKVIAKLREASEDDRKREELCQRLGLDPRQFSKERFRTMLRQALLSSNRLTMGTLDSFFAKLVNNFPLEVGLSSGAATTIPDQETEKLRLKAVQTIVQKLDVNAAAVMLANLKDFNDGEEIANPLESLAEMAKAYHGLLVSAPEPSLWGNADAIWADGKPRWAGYADTVDAAAEWAKVEGFLLQQFGSPDKYPKNCRTLGEAAASTRCDNGTANDLAEYFRATLDRPEGMSGVISHRGPIDVPIDAADGMRRLVWRAIDQLVRARLKQTQALRLCLGDYEATYDEQNRRTGLLGFSDYVTLLTHAEPFDRDEMAYRLDCTIKHWLLDEFQDTSTQQFEVLKRNISEIVDQPQEDRSVFVVGDLKQSLYEWRAGNRKLLGNLHRDIARNGVNLNLDETRRCAPAVLEMVNDVLGGHAEQGLGRLYSESAAADWSATFHTQKAVTEAGKPAKPGEAAWARITKPKESDESDPQLHARWIGAHLKATAGVLEADGRLKPGITCAILVSKNKQAAEITQVLRQLSIEATDEAKTSVIEDNPVTAGLLALIQATIHPDNGLAKGMAEISPAAAGFLAERGGWEGAAEAIANTFAESGAEGLADLLARGVDLTGDSGFVRKRLGQLRSVALAYDASGRRDLAEFAGFCSASQLRDSADPQTVQVITIHRSKGLEYDMVYMPCLNSRQPIAQLRTGELLSMPTSDEDFSPKWLLASVGTDVAHLDPTLSAAVMRAKSESAYGNLCRMYVGMTRAKHRLIMVSTALSEDKLTSLETENGKADFAGLLEMTLGKLGKPTDVSLGGIEASMAWQAAGEGAAWIATRTQEEEAKARRQAGGRASIVAQRYTPAQVLEKLRPSKPTDGKIYGWKPSSDEPGGRELGNLVHGLMQSLGWDIEGFLGGLENATVAPESAALKAPAIELVRQCLGSAEVRKLLGEAPQGVTLWLERKAALVHDGKLLSAVFDRVHVIPGQSATVIDYKTNDCSVEVLREMYQGQMDLYRVAVGRLCGLEVGKVRCVLVHVRKGELVEA